MSAERTPRFSIVTATHNRSQLVGRAIRSALAQTFEDFELIVVDDGSTDNTSTILDTFDDPRMQTIYLEANQGVSAAKNVGLQEARGGYISILDSDDEFLPGFLSEMDRLIRIGNAGVGVYFANRIQVRDTPEGELFLGKDLLGIPARVDPYLYFLRERPGGTGFGPTFSRTALDAVGLFDEELGSAIDKDLILRIFRKGFDFAQSPLYLYKTHLHDGDRVTAHTQTKALSYERIYGKHEESLARHPDIAAQAFNHLATLHHLAGNWGSQVLWIRRAVRKKPLKARLLAKWGAFEVQRILFHLGTRLRKTWEALK